MRFRRVLLKADRGLGVAGPGRARILAEMATDLEGLYAEYVARGMEPAEAERRAEEVLGASDEAVEELARMHAAPFALLLWRLSKRDRHLVERTLLTGLTALAVLGGMQALATSGLSRSPSPFVWPLVGLGAAAAALAGARLIELFGPGGAKPGPPGRLRPLLAIAALCAASGALGAMFESWRLADLASRGDLWGPHGALSHLARAAELVTLGLSLSLAVLLAWLHLRTREAAITRASEEVRRLTSFTHHTGGES